MMYATPSFPTRSFVSSAWRAVSSCLLFMVLALALMPARAQDRDSEFVRIYGNIQDADALDQSGQTAKALAKYRQAHTDLLKLRGSYPDWNAKAVGFRVNYLTVKINDLTRKLAPPPAADTDTNRPQSAGSSSAGSLKLLQAGAEPKKQLRFHPKAGDKTTLNLTLNLGMEIAMAETKMPAIKIPPVTMVLEAEVKSVSPEGDIVYELNLSDVTTPGDANASPQAAMMKASLESAKGAKGKITTSNRGIGKGIDFQPPAGADPGARQSVDQMKEVFTHLMTPVPEEPVGVGAKWEVRVPVKSQGMSINQTTTYELAALDEDQLTLKVSVAQRAAPQKVSNPAMPGLKMDLTKMAGTGSGESTLSLAQVTPAQATMDMHSEMAMSMTNAGQKQEMQMTLDVKVSMEGK